MRVFKSIIILIVFFAGVSSFAQNSLKVNLEYKIKTNPDYIYIQTIENDTIEGKANAAEILCQSQEFKDEISENGDLYKSAISYLTKSRGPKYMIIAYINKSSVGKIKKKKTASNIKWELTEKIPIENETDEEPEKVKKDPVPDIIEKSSAKEDYSKPELPGVENKKEALINKGSEKENHDKGAKLKEDERDNKINNYHSSSVVLNKLAEHKTFKEIIDYLSKEKNKGNIVYSYRYDAFKDNISDCYIIVLKPESEKVSMILDKGSSSRINVLTSRIVEKKEYENTNKIYVYEF